MYPVWSWIFLHVELERSQSVSFRLTPPTQRVWKRGDNVGVMLSYGKKKIMERNHKISNCGERTIQEFISNDDCVELDTGCPLVLKCKKNLM